MKKTLGVVFIVLFLCNCIGNKKSIYPKIGKKREHLFKCDSAKKLVIVFATGFRNDSIIVKNENVVSFSKKITTASQAQSTATCVLNNIPESVNIRINKKNYIIYTKKGYCYVYVYKKLGGVKYITYPGSLGPFM